MPIQMKLTSHSQKKTNAPVKMLKASGRCKFTESLCESVVNLLNVPRLAAERNNSR